MGAPSRGAMPSERTPSVASSVSEAPVSTMNRPWNLPFTVTGARILPPASSTWTVVRAADVGASRSEGPGERAAISASTHAAKPD